MKSEDRDAAVLRYAISASGRFKSMACSLATGENYQNSRLSLIRLVAAGRLTPHYGAGGKRVMAYSLAPAASPVAPLPVATRRALNVIRAASPVPGALVYLHADGTPFTMPDAPQPPAGWWARMCRALGV